MPKWILSELTSFQKKLHAGLLFSATAVKGNFWVAGLSSRPSPIQVSTPYRAWLSELLQLYWQRNRYTRLQSCSLYHPSLNSVKRPPGLPTSISGRYNWYFFYRLAVAGESVGSWILQAGCWLSPPASRPQVHGFAEGMLEKLELDDEGKPSLVSMLFPGNTQLCQ